MNSHIAWFRFYEELNDFLSADKRKIAFAYKLSGSPSVKDVIEAVGVPHTEVDLILINGNSVKFDHILSHGDHISVYPVFENFDISHVTRLRPEPLRETRFIVDVHLGRLSRLLRMLGFDTLYKNNYKNEEIITEALTQKRIILTRDPGLLKNRSITHGYLIRGTDPHEQAQEVIQRFDLYSQAKPFIRFGQRIKSKNQGQLNLTNS
ncbi:MAG: Mut7-C ubiquitin/RNAse domain-containing protein [Proteobacteria bacterium]|nr:Mut7-C ubiquitin/RNAse domain-containing protein [Pseudomonadota bacterium]